MSAVDGVQAENLAYPRCEACGIEWIRHKGIMPICAENMRPKDRVAELEKHVNASIEIIAAVKSLRDHFVNRCIELELENKRLRDLIRSAVDFGWNSGHYGDPCDPDEFLRKNNIEIWS